jgi:DNA polymerase-3 subunit delta
MNRQLEVTIARLENGNGPSVVLLFGDDFAVEEACKTIVNLMVPESQRAFNLERFDGRSTAWDRIEASLETPPFLPGKKLVWVENAPYFLSREQGRQLGDRVLQLWLEGKKDAACQLLIDLLKMEAWTQQRWEEAKAGASVAALAELLGAEARDEVEQLLAYCQTSGLDLGEARPSDGQRLFQLLESGLPPWGFLLMTATEVDRRTRLHKRLEQMGAALYLGLERDRSGRVSRENLLEFINRRVAQAGKTIGFQARELILLRAGEDLRGLGQELDKLLLYVGEQPEIRPRDVEAIVADRDAGWVFDLTRALGDRNGVAALSHLGRLLEQGEHALKLLATVASDIRKLLAARQLMDRELAGRWRRGMTYQQFQQTVLRNDTPLLTRNAYADYISFQRAEKFSLRDLRFLLAEIYDADLRLKSSANQPRLVMERLIFKLCLETRNNHAPLEQRATL